MIPALSMVSCQEYNKSNSPKKVTKSETLPCVHPQHFFSFQSFFFVLKKWALLSSCNHKTETFKFKEFMKQELIDATKLLEKFGPENVLVVSGLVAQGNAMRISVVVSSKMDAAQGPRTRYSIKVKGEGLPEEGGRD